MQDKLKQDLKRKILCDPLVSEATWLPACDVGRAELSASPQNDIVKITLAAVAFLLTILTCLYVAAAGFLSIHLAFDWGYYLVEQFFGQTKGNSQGLMADLVLFVIIAPLFFAMALASFERFRKKRWFYAIPTLAAFLLAEYAFSGQNMDKLGLLIYAGIIASFFLSGFVITKKVVSYLKFRIRIRAVFTTCFSCITVMGIISYLAQEQSVHWHLELLLYSSVLFGAGIMSAYLAKVENKTAAILIPVISTAPIMAINLINILGTSISLILDQIGRGFTLGAEALYSACIITTVSLACTSTGGLLALKLRTKK